MQNTLTDLVSTLREGIPSTTSNGSALMSSAIATTPDYGPIGHMTHPIGHLSSMGMIPSSSPTANMGAFDQSGFRRVSGSSADMSLPFWTGAPSPSGLMGQREFTANDYTSLPVGPNFGFPPRQEMLPPQPSRLDGSEQGNSSGYNRTQTSPYMPIPDVMRPSIKGGQSGRRMVPTGPSHPFPWSTQNHLVQQSAQNRHMSLPPSRVGSVGPDDILAPEEIINPLGAMSNMAGLVEAAVERAREEQQGNAPQNPGSTPSKRSANEAETVSGEDAPPSKPAKKARFSPPPPSGPAVIESQNLPPTSGPAKGKAKSKTTHIHAYPDAVAEGYVTEEEGREMMQM